MIEELQEDEPVLIGRPAYGNSIYILAPGDVLTPIGVAGEICIGGQGVGQGYLNQPALTAEKFVADPFKAGERCTAAAMWAAGYPMAASSSWAVKTSR